MSSEPPETTPAPGWYEDPHGGGDGLRWWDGSAWTEHTLDDVPPSNLGVVEEDLPAVAVEPAVPVEPDPAPAASTVAPDADSLMAMYGARPVSAPRPGSGGPDYSRYKMMIGILVLGLIAIVAGLLLVGGGDDDLSTGVGDQTAAADAQSLLRTAQTALETYAVDRGGSYNGATAETLAEIEPSLAGAEIEVTADAATFTLTITDPTGENSYSIARQSTGAVTFGCTPEGTPGCPPGGDWGAQPAGNHPF